MSVMATNGTEPQRFKLSSLTFSIYVPTLLFSIGQGAVIPAIPLFARDLGSSVAAAALIVALRGIGQLIFDMPAGLIVSRWGEKSSMIAGMGLIAMGAVGAAVSPTPEVLGFFVLIMGGGWSFWNIGRLSYVSEVAPLEQRGRALSMTGGMNRIGNFIGPTIGGFLGQFLGQEFAFAAQAIMATCALLLVFRFMVPATTSIRLASMHGFSGRVAQTVSENRGVFARVGPPIIALGLLRQARQVFLPLWGDQIGLSSGQIGLITSASFFVDAAMFYPIGFIMDSKGRKWVAVPCLTILAIGLLALPLTYDFATFLMIGMLTGLGNGLGSGINMTLGSDFSPPTGRGEFLGVWRLVSDIGQASGPIVVSALTGLGSLTLASLASGGIGVTGAAIMLLFVPETLNRARRVIVVAQQPAEEPTTGSG